MPLSPEFPKSPYEILDPDVRWYPGESELSLLEDYHLLLPPLVDKLRREVKVWRDNKYEGASDTSKALLKWWFESEHPIETSSGIIFDFQYYFCQREAIEVVVYLHDVVKFRDKHDLMRYDSSGAVSAGMFYETWKRLVIKMATGSGKTKVMSLLLAWCYFHKLYEENSDLSTNFLIIAPNIIVLDRLRQDFDGLKIFYQDPILPENGYEGQDWQSDFQLKLHIQDYVNITRNTNNIFLTNIHRVYEGNISNPSFEDEDTSEYFLGSDPVTKTNESLVDLGEIVRNIDEIIVFNDEAHHIHNEKLGWFKSIADINNRLVQKGKQISLQLDVTATPKHENASIFVQTISDYPLVEAIYQNIVKHPVLPDQESRSKLKENQSSKFTVKYRDYLKLGYIEWKKAYDEHIKAGKKAVMFVMTDDTKNCDEVAQYLENTYPELLNSVLVIHTKRNGEISESDTNKEIEVLRKLANEIDSLESPYKVIVSVMVLKEGWDVRNVCTIVGLRPYGSPAKILPEQTLGRGLRKMYTNETEEYVSVLGTGAFIEFVEDIQDQGVELEYKPMGERSIPLAPLVIEIDEKKDQKKLDNLNILIPILSPTYSRDYKLLSNVNPDNFQFTPLELKNYPLAELREIKFEYTIKKENSDENIHHTTVLGENEDIDFIQIVGYFAKVIMHEARLVSGYDTLFSQVLNFIKYKMYGKEVDLENRNVIKNLNESAAVRLIVDTFVSELNKAIVVTAPNPDLKENIDLLSTRPFMVKRQLFYEPNRSVFNKIVGDNPAELKFAEFLDKSNDIISFTKNYFAISFKLDYIKTTGEISNYYTDFIVKRNNNEIWIIEYKGMEDIEVPQKINRLKGWINDVNNLQDEIKYEWLFVDDYTFKMNPPSNFQELIDLNYNNYRNNE